MLPPLPSVLTVLKTKVGTDPAANAEISEAVPTGKHWILYAVTAPLVQGATQTPQPILIIDDGTNVLFESFGATGAQSASTTARYSWVPGGVLAGLVGATPDIHAVAPLPYGLVLRPGYRVRTNTLGKGANTDWGAPVLYIAELG